MNEEEEVLSENDDDLTEEKFQNIEDVSLSFSGRKKKKFKNFKQNKEGFYFKMMVLFFSIEAYFLFTHFFMASQINNINSLFEEYKMVCLIESKYGSSLNSLNNMIY